jgi:hypothetical protein
VCVGHAGQDSSVSVCSHVTLSPGPVVSPTSAVTCAVSRPLELLAARALRVGMAVVPIEILWCEARPAGVARPAACRKAEPMEQ